MTTEYQSLVAHATEVLALAKRLTEQKQEEAPIRQDENDHAARVGDLRDRLFVAEVKIGELTKHLAEAHEALRQTYRVALDAVYAYYSQNTEKDVL